EASIREEPQYPEPAEAVDLSAANRVEEVAPETDHNAELLRIRAERVLTDAADNLVEATPDDGVAAEPIKSDIEAPEAERETISIVRGKYGALLNFVDETRPQNWNQHSEERAMREEHGQNSVPAPQVDGRPRPVTLDGASNTITITKESRFSGQLKFSG